MKQYSKNGKSGKMEFTSEVAEISLAYIPKKSSRDLPKITSSNESYDLLLPHFEPYMHLREVTYVIHLSRSNRVLGIQRINEGGVTYCSFDIRLCVQGALLLNSSCMILAHCHPSGNNLPSRQDVALTQNVKKACELFSISLLDHVILAEDTYYSFADEGMI